MGLLLVVSLHSKDDWITSIVASMKKKLSADIDITAGSILLLAKKPRQVSFLVSLLGCRISLLGEGYSIHPELELPSTSCHPDEDRLHADFSVYVAHSEAQAVVYATHYPPFLVILSGDYATWSRSLLQELRSLAIQPMTLILLTDDHIPSWVDQEDNPGFDGFLVNPISREILFALIHSAYTRQACFAFR